MFNEEKKDKKVFPARTTHAVMALCVAVVITAIIGGWLLTLGTTFERIDSQVAAEKKGRSGLFESIGKEFYSLSALWPGSGAVKGIQVEEVTEEDLKKMEEKVFGRVISE